MTREEYRQVEEAKKARKEVNMRILALAPFPFIHKGNETLIFETHVGKVCFYPTADKFQHKGSIMRGDASVVIEYINGLIGLD